jgi:hypothetical protein
VGRLVGGETLGSLAAGTWWPGRTLRVAAMVLVEVTYAIVAPRRPMGSAVMRPSTPPPERLSSRR